VKILVVEGNTPELVERVAAVGGTPAAERYGDVVRALRADAECAIVRPYFPDQQPDAVDLDVVDGVILTGSGVSWSAADARAAPHCTFLEWVFARGIPVLGSCWGLQVGAMVLGGDVAASDRGYELALARHIRTTEAGAVHPFHSGRPASFDAVCIHRDEVTRVPSGAVVTAANDHSAIQAMIYEEGSTRFWGVQYHPEMTLGDIAGILSLPEPNMSREAIATVDDAMVETVANDFRSISDDPDASGSVQWRYGIRPEIVDFTERTREIANWLGSL